MRSENPDPHEARPRQTLQSWKEIAGFLGVTIRSVQRWEAEGLPVYRRDSGAKARVFAYTDELQAWMQSKAVAPPVPGQPEISTTEPEPHPRFRWYYVVAGALILTLIGFVVWRSRIPEPRTWKWDGTKLAVFDSAGKILWSKQVGPIDTGSERARDLAVVADIDGDGHNETLLNFIPANIQEQGGSLYCYDRFGGLRWQHLFGGIRRFGDRVFEPNYRGRFVRPMKTGGKLLVLTIANHFLWYPAQVALLDPRTGREIAEYWHPGSIYHYLLRDTNADGAEELVFAAINNAGDGLGNAAVGVLKLPVLRVPPTADPNPLPSPTGGGELVYGLLPWPDVCRNAGMLPQIQDLTFDALGRLRILLPTPENGGTVYYLDNRLKVLEYHLADNFGPLHNRLYRTHQLDHALSENETAEYGRIVLFSAAPAANSPEVRRIWQY